ncbi:MAG TPA: GWxTD domain-containing protein [Thermoanaerobaculia bacterium]|jgi:GWxTD domain-containing protein
MNRLALRLTVCTAVIAANAFAVVSPQYREWGNSAVQYLMMKQEKIDWSALRTDDDAKAFIDLFWARRDPTPDTPANELRQQFEARIADADKRFTVGRTPGTQTDRGLVYVLFGEPSQIVNRLTKRGSVAGMSQFQRPINVETWIYRGEAAERVAGTQSFEPMFSFHDEKMAGEFQLDGPSQQSFDSMTLAVAKRVLKRPFLTAADLASGGASVRTVALGLIVVSDKALAYDVLRRAQEGEKFSDLARKHSSHHSAKDGGYLGRIPFAELEDDFKAALAGKEPGTTVVIARPPQFAVVRLLTEAEASAADVVMPKSN